VCIQNRKVQNSLRYVGNCFAISSSAALESGQDLWWQLWGGVTLSSTTSETFEVIDGHTHVPSSSSPKVGQVISYYLRVSNCDLEWPWANFFQLAKWDPSDNEISAHNLRRSGFSYRMTVYKNTYAVVVAFTLLVGKVKMSKQKSYNPLVTCCGSIIFRTQLLLLLPHFQWGVTLNTMYTYRVRVRGGQQVPGSYGP
jgi:hypothetical protein